MATPKTEAFVTDHQLVRLLADLIHIFTRMETTMALKFDELTAQVADLESKVADLKNVPAGGSGVDEAAAQAQLDSITARAKAALADFAAQLDRLKTSAEPAPAPAPDPSVATPL